MEEHKLQSINLGVLGATCTHIYARGLYQSQDTGTLAPYQKILTSFESPSNPFNPSSWFKRSSQFGLVDL